MQTSTFKHLKHKPYLIQTLARCFCDKPKVKTYTQGRSPSPGIREYFFFVDHNGMLFQDDSKMKHWTAAMKEKKLLFNFFKRLRFNETNRYSEEFKYISL